ncbi:MAG: hypothetical protein KGR99_10935 [Betaproteobacteria bacterium]|nr:hypothetical protein [Betaproteobacteria bacterium]MDE2150804.1 hypothetical protein [Betaproteobacteria bacterium]
MTGRAHLERFGAPSDIDPAAIDALVMDVFDDESLRTHVRELEKVELSSVWRLMQGLAGEALLVSSAMFLDLASYEAARSYMHTRNFALGGSTPAELVILEVFARPGWDGVDELSVVPIEVPDGTVVERSELGNVLPSNGNLRPAGPNAGSVGGEFLAAVDREACAGRRIRGVRVPSVISTTDHDVLLDPRQKASFSVAAWARIPGAEQIITKNGESHAALIDDAKRGLGDIEAGRTYGAPERR